MTTVVDADRYIKNEGFFGNDDLRFYRGDCEVATFKTGLWLGVYVCQYDI